MLYTKYHLVVSYKKIFSYVPYINQSATKAVDLAFLSTLPSHFATPFRQPNVASYTHISYVHGHIIKTDIKSSDRTNHNRLYTAYERSATSTVGLNCDFGLK